MGRTTWLLATAAMAALGEPAFGQSDAASFLSDWDAVAKAARAQQPDWASPIATTTGLLEQRFRLDLEDQHAGNGAATLILDGGKGLDVIVSETNEIQVGLAPYEFRSSSFSGNGHEGFGDWAFVRVEQRLAASPSREGNYVVTTWLQVQAPTGAAPFTNGAWTFLPTLALGKGWGAFDMQATVAGVLPTANVALLGHQVQSNVAFQYHLEQMFWPELEINWTYYPDGQRAGLNQVFLTPGFTVGRFHLSAATSLTVGIGYQVALSPSYRAKPLTPVYGNALLLATRINF
jgi:hypothetical protein